MGDFMMTNNSPVMAGIVWLIVIAAIVVVFRRARSRRRHFDIGPGASGTIYDWLNEEKRNAVEIIVEEKAAERDEERAEDDEEKGKRLKAKGKT
jgi:hypothetical protein